MFEVIPSIDIRAGKVVRLTQGDYARETIYADDPVAIAKSFESAGAARIHVVDLDGAKAGHPVNGELVRSIARAVDLPIELGGGIRSIATIEQVLNAGVQRVVLGTAAAENRELVVEAVERWSERIVVGVDARDGMVATHGWTRSERLAAADLMRSMESEGVVRFIYTDIAQDGILQGPNFASIEQLLEASGAALIASGGVTTIEHLKRLAGMGVEGAIIGRALYTGDLDLRAAVRAAPNFPAFS